MRPAPVVAALADAAGAAALGWAAAEAARRSTDLVVTSLPGASTPDERAARHAVLDEAVEGVRRVRPGLAVTVDRSGAPGYRHLLALSHEAALLALPAGARTQELVGVQDPPLVHRLAVHAGCPVVVVPEPPPDGTPTHGRVASGWSRGRSGRRALAVAAGEAAVRGSWLTLVHVLPPEDPEVVRTLGPVDHERAIDAALVAVEREHRGLVVDVLRRHGRVVDELARAGAGADLLVVGCHHSRQRWSDRPGQVAEELLGSPPCPLMLVGVADPQDALAGVPVAPADAGPAPAAPAPGNPPSAPHDAPQSRTRS